MNVVGPHYDLIILTQALLLAMLATCLATWASSALRFQTAVRKHREHSRDATAVPLKPYAIPVLGSALGMMSTNIGEFWNNLMRYCERYDLSNISLLVFGTRTHILFSAPEILAEFKSKHLTRYKHARQLGTNVLGMTEDQAAKAFPKTLDRKTNVTLEQVHTESLLAISSVTTLTNNFMSCLIEKTAACPGIDSGVEVELYAWTKDILFFASTNALFGTKLLNMFPDLQEDFWVWEQNLLTLLFGTPRIFARKAYAARENLSEKFQQWLKVGYECTGKMDLADTEWEPYFGSKVMRRRHEYYNQQNLNLRSQAGKEMIFLAGIVSNAIPTIGWALAHIFSPESKDLLNQLRKEIVTAQRDDKSFDVVALARLPLLNATVNEVLRLYIDLLVIRQVEQDGVLCNIPVRKGEQVIASSWMMQRNATNFERPEHFDPTRFLKQDPKTGELRCSIQGMSGQYFPFGGGAHMCPGRNFARQEIVATIAVLLKNFDIQFLSFVERKKSQVVDLGKDAHSFPKMVKALPGNQVMGLKGDLKVKITKREM